MSGEPVPVSICGAFHACALLRTYRLVVVERWWGQSNMRKGDSQSEVYPEGGSVDLKVPSGIDPHSFQGISVRGNGRNVVAIAGGGELVYWSDRETTFVHQFAKVGLGIVSNVNSESPSMVVEGSDERRAQYSRVHLSGPSTEVGSP